MLGGFLLINPFLVAFAPTYFTGLIDPDLSIGWVTTVFPYILIFNVLSFWFPLGFTYEVLRRARSGNKAQLPDWSFSLLGRYAREGSVKLFISLFTLILPVLIWVGLCAGIFHFALGLPLSMLSLMIHPIFLFTIPFCAIGCCRWLDGESVWKSAFDYPTSLSIFGRRWKEFLIASAFLTGVNQVTTSLFYTIPFAAVFGLCLVDTWFGPIYASAVDAQHPASYEEEAKLDQPATPSEVNSS